MAHASTRREFLSTSATGALGLATAATTAAAANAVEQIGHAHPDAALLALRDPYDRTYAGIKTAGPIHGRAEDAVTALRRLHPNRDLADLEKAAGFDVADARWNAAVDANSDVIDQITEIQARTLEGLIFKARVAKVDSFNLELAASIIDDLVAMGGGLDA